MFPTSLCKDGFKDILKFKAKIDSMLLTEYVVLMTRLDRGDPEQPHPHRRHPCLGVGGWN